MHPILRAVRPHPGVDFAAPIGTPIRAIGAGKIVMARWDGGFGRTLRIDHGFGLSSQYSHMNAFAPDIHAGARVEMGHAIGTVGVTGFATGPHCHFALWRNGAYVNPLTAKLPASAPLDRRFQAQFIRARDEQLAELSGDARVYSVASRAAAASSRNSVRPAPHNRWPDVLGALRGRRLHPRRVRHRGRGSLFVEPDRIVRYLGGRNLGSAAVAAILGAPLPLCSCGVLPTAVSLRRKGASPEATLSFLITTPETGIDSVAMTFAFFGPLFAIVRVLAAIATGLVAAAPVAASLAASQEPPPESSITESDADAPSTLEQQFEGRDTPAPKYRRSDGSSVHGLAAWVRHGGSKGAVPRATPSASSSTSSASGWCSRSC